MNKAIKHNFFTGILIMAAWLFVSNTVSAQAKLVINGGVINISNGAALVIDSNIAIIRNGAGYIKSERADNIIYWNLGSGNGNTYLLPFGNETGYFPLQFTATSGTGKGYFVFSTYPTATWKNSDQLPAAVTNANKDGADNSAKMIDRFWQISPRGYTKNPFLTNLLFTYNDAELAAPNTIVEANLVAQRWNPTPQNWNDYITLSAVNTNNNMVAVSSVESNQLFNWWTLTDLKLSVAVGIVNFKAVVNNRQVFTSWQTAAEQNNDHFEVWRSKDGVQFEYVGTVPSAGNNTGINNYSFVDPNPYTGTSYYQLKSIDKNGGVKLSAIVSVTIDLTTGIFLYPNPAVHYTTIYSSSAIIATKPLANLYDAKGSLVQTFTLSATSQQLNTDNLASGTYNLIISTNNFLRTLRFIKQ